MLLLDLAALTPAQCLTLSNQKNCGDDLGGVDLLKSSYSPDISVIFNAD